MTTSVPATVTPRRWPGGSSAYEAIRFLDALETVDDRAVARLADFCARA
jgi:hypothetical protein